MTNIFIGFLLIFLDFNLNVDTSTIGLIPDFIGYIVLIKGLKELMPESPAFAKAKPFATGMGIYSAIVYLLDLFGVFINSQLIGFIIGIIGTIISLYISHLIIDGVKDIETAHMADLNSAGLGSTWIIMAVFQLGSYASMLFPAISVICIIVALLSAIVFLVQFSRTKNLYTGLPL